MINTIKIIRYHNKLILFITRYKIIIIKTQAQHFLKNLNNKIKIIYTTNVKINLHLNKLLNIQNKQQWNNNKKW